MQLACTKYQQQPPKVSVFWKTTGQLRSTSKTTITMVVCVCLFALMSVNYNQQQTHTISYNT